MTNIETTKLQPNASLIRAAQMMTTIGGAIIFLFGALGGLIYVLAIFLSTDSATESAVTGMAVVVLSIGLGGALVWHGVSALRNQGSLPFRPPSGWLILLPYIPALIIG